MLGLSLGIPFRQYDRSAIQQMLDALRRNNGSLWYVPDNLAGTYVENVGTTPVTAVGDLIGKVSDKTGTNHATQSAVASKPSFQRVPKRLGPSMATGPWVNNYSNAFDTFTSTASSACAATTTAAKSNVRVGVPISGVVAGKTQQIRFTPVFTGGTVASVWLADSGLSGLQNANVTVTSGVPVVVDVPYTAVGTPARVMIIFNATGASTFSITNFDIQEVLEWANVISFDGNNDFLQTGITTGNEGFVAAGVTVGSATQAIFSSGAGSGTEKGAQLLAISGLFAAYVGNGTTRVSVNRAFTQNSPQVASMGWSSAGVFAGVDSTETAPTAFTGDVTGAAALRIGQTPSNTLPLNGPMHAIAYAPVLPDAATRKIIRNGIAALQGRVL